MHKDDASYLFGILADENAVKMAKMLYNKGDMDIDMLFKATGCGLVDFNKALTSMLEGELVLLNDTSYSINRPLLDTLLKFIVTPCGCVHK